MISDKPTPLALSLRQLHNDYRHSPEGGWLWMTDTGHYFKLARRAPSADYPTMIAIHLREWEISETEAQKALDSWMLYKLDAEAPEWIALRVRALIHC